MPDETPASKVRPVCRSTAATETLPFGAAAINLANATAAARRTDSGPAFAAVDPVGDVGDVGGAAAGDDDVGPTVAAEGSRRGLPGAVTGALAQAARAIATPTSAPAARHGRRVATRRG
jgi:hypothetical protein